MLLRKEQMSLRHCVTASLRHNSWIKFVLIIKIRFLKILLRFLKEPSFVYVKGMLRTGHPNASYDPFGCFARVEGMLPYPPKEAFGRRLQMPPTPYSYKKAT